MTALADKVAEIVAALDLGKASARKGGRNPRWPYVPIIVHPDRPLSPTSQIKGLAFATRGEAVDAAQAHLDRLRAKTAEDLLKPNMRALREHHGLPRDLQVAEDLARVEAAEAAVIEATDRGLAAFSALRKLER